MSLDCYPQRQLCLICMSWEFPVDDGILWYFVVALCIVLLPRGNCRLWELVGTGGKNLR